MTTEIFQQSPILSDPQSIQEIHGDYFNGRNLNNREMMTISHLLPNEARGNFMAKYGQEMAAVWNTHMAGRVKFYEPMVENLTEYRPDIVRAISPKAGDEIVDLGAGLCPLAHHFAVLTPGVSYYATDASEVAEKISSPKLEFLKQNGSLSEAKFFHHNYLQGMPEGLPSKNGAKRIAVSSFSLSYMPADVIVNTVKNSLAKGSDEFFITSIDPANFDADKMLDEMLETSVGKGKSEEVIAMAQNESEGREFMKTFVQILKENVPLRTPDEMEFYLRQAGRIEKKVVFGSGTGRSVGFLVVQE